MNLAILDGCVLNMALRIVDGRSNLWTIFRRSRLRAITNVSNHEIGLPSFIGGALESQN